MAGSVGAQTARALGAASTREALMDAALAVFTEQTYAGTAVPIVAERAGVAVGTIYRHFPSKQALGNAVFQRWKGRLLERLRAKPAGDGSARAEFAHLWGALREFALSHPDAFAFLEYQQHASYLDPESVALIDASTALAREMVVRGQQRAEIRQGDPDVLVALAYGAFIGLSKAQWAGLHIGKTDFDAAEAAVWDLLRA